MRLMIVLFAALLVILGPACSSNAGDSEATDGDAAIDDGDLELNDGDEDTTETELEGEAPASCINAWDPTAPLPMLHTQGRLIRDSYGRSAMLRGVNAGGRAKIPPHLPWQDSDKGDPGYEDDLNRYYDFPADWGMNCIRLTVFWEAIEPERGEYDEDYLEKVIQQIQAAQDRRMYVFVDFHQDLYSRILGGSGAPRWALPDPNIEAIPLDDFNWFMRYFGDEQVEAAFDHFWSNTDSVQDAYVAMVSWVAERVAPYPNVIGIDMMNEPSAGSAGTGDVAAWFSDKLKPFYEQLGAAIRKVAPYFILIAESSNAEAGGGELDGTLPRPDLNNFIFAPHYYNPLQFVTGYYNGNIEDIEEGLARWDDIGLAFDSPILLSEYGFRGYNDAGNPGEYLDDHYDVMDALLMHGTLWSHEVCSDYWNHEDCALVDHDWSERKSSADAVSRPYPKFTSGEPLSFEYTVETRTVTYRYLTANTDEAPTVIALPARHYPGEPQVELAFGEWSYDEQKRELHIFDRICDRGAAPGEEQLLRITP